MPSKHNYVMVCKFNYSMSFQLASCCVVVRVCIIYKYCHLIDNGLTTKSAYAIIVFT